MPPARCARGLAAAFSSALRAVTSRAPAPPCAAPEQVDPRKVPILAGWQYEYSIKDVLCALREGMVAAARLRQPGPDETYDSGK